MPCEHCGSADCFWIPPKMKALMHEAHDFLCRACWDDGVDMREEEDLRLIGYLDYGPKVGT